MPNLPTTGANFPAGSALYWQANTYTGIPGGIPSASWTTVAMTGGSYPYNCDPTGNTDCSANINAAIGAHNNTQTVLLFPAGTFLASANQISGPGYSGGLGAGVFNVVIRGAGSSTIFKGPNFYFGANSGFGYSGNSSAISSSTLTAGTTTIQVADTTQFYAYQMVRIAQQPDLTIPVFAVDGLMAIPQKAQAQTNQIVSINASASTVTLSLPLYYTYSSALSPTLYGNGNQAVFQSANIGLENFYCDESGNSYTQPLIFEQCQACWIKNVTVYEAAGYGLFLNKCLQMEISGSTFGPLNHGGTNGSNVLVQQSAACLLYDNIFQVGFPLVEINYGSCGNVFGHNLFYNTNANDGARPGEAIATNHGSGNSFNLFEGNIAANTQSDGLFGSETTGTHYRNWYQGVDPGNSFTACGPALIIDRFSRNHQFIANLYGTTGKAWPSSPGDPGNVCIGPYQFGLPNIGNNGWNGSASLKNGTPWREWSLAGTVASGGNTTTATINLTAGYNISSSMTAWIAQAQTSGGGSYNNFNSATVTWAGGNFSYVQNTPFTPYAVSSAGASSLTITCFNSFPANGTAVSLYSGSNGYQEQDLDVYTSCTCGASWDIYANTLGSLETFGVSSYTLPGSLYLTAKPSWFYNLAYPAFDPVTPTATVLNGGTFPGHASYPAGFQAIPAAYLFVTGGAPVGVASLTAVNVTFH